MKQFKIAGLFALSLFSLAALSGCNTIAGAGQDIEATGDAIEEEASN